MKIGIALVIVVMLQGCVMDQQITDDAVAYNKSVERMQNELILLNVVRAMHRRPMHFTSLNLIRGNLRTSVDGSLKIPFGGGGTTTNVSGNVGGSYSSNPSFDVAVLDSEKFMRGILTPMSVDLFGYYWNQGWPKQMLVSLFVRKIVVTQVDKNLEKTRKTIYENFPDDITTYYAFQNAIKDCKNWIFKPYKKNIEVIGSDLVDTKAKDFDLLTKAYTAGLRVEKIKKPAEEESDDEVKYKLVKRINSIHLFGRIDEFPGNMDIKPYDLLTEETDSTAPVKMEPQENVPGKKAPDSLDLDKKAMEISGLDLKATFYMRSPEAIIYHLGELLRAQQNYPDTFPHLKLSEYDPYQKKWIDARLFVAHQNTMNESAIVRVNYEGKDYIIPIADPEDLEAGPGRSMHCLTLVSQLLALHKSSEEMPSTSAVTLVGR